MKRLSFSQTKTDTQRLFELKAKYKNLIYGDDTTDKDLKTIAEQLQQMPKTPPVTIRKFEGDYNFLQKRIIRKNYLIYIMTIK